ncbi:multicopper oxidase family protein [Methylocystis parvus]|uniref:Multicopper oxidase domain-containing protein n=1 Tax=Methylocystis parvus TaxID=134 RepID=A0A6B8M983_9HYPH|nr:multicopper oxidase domain-containing protein [Methylocystis parvus]QGM99216.1 multicopper oxidase domain-containing protein [Methylocystis parvus]WBK00403.1 multicopper oxidase domain-containing protein [Methylocystis parvus OBBP]
MLLKFENHLPLAALDVVSTGQTSAWGCVTFSAEARSVKLTDAIAAPKDPNAWCYIRSGSPQERADKLENYLGPVINVTRGRPLKTVWINRLPSMTPAKAGDARALAMPPINPFPMEFGEKVAQFKSMNYSLGVVTHLHGGKVQATSDGWPLHPASYDGNPFFLPSYRQYLYPNDQRAAMLWFHDHGMDNTAPQVHAGLAGLYFVRDESDAEIFHLIGGEAQELPLVIQDRWFAEPSAQFPAFTAFDYRKGVPLADNPDGGRPEFLGGVIVVNGRPWPHAHVNPNVYRLRLLNGSNARTYALTIADPSAKSGGKVWRGDLLTAIGNDGGLLCEAAPVGEMQYLLLAPGERLDVLLDLTSVPPDTDLHLVNLALAGYDPQKPEDAGIFQTDDESVVAPGDEAAKLIAYDANTFDAAEPLAHVLLFQVRAEPHDHGGSDHSKAPAPELAIDALNGILRRYAADESFHALPGAHPQLAPNPVNAQVARNRFVLLMNNTAGLGGASPHTRGPWRDTQMWELRPATNPASDQSVFSLPFDAHLGDPSRRGETAGPVAYQVSRAFFFEPEDPAPPHAPRNEDPLWGIATENANPAGFPPVFRYPHIYRNQPASGRKVAKPTEGTYERWYVANIGNDFSNLGAKKPDMHPFHMHLVNFVVLKRWKVKDGGNQFEETTGGRPLDFDGVARHDTVRAQSNELLELLVHFPRGYTGRYPYHCHLVEHEDMGMMLHFEVQPRSPR